MTSNIEQAFGFAEICAALSERFGTSFELENTGGHCVTLMAKLEGGIKLLITDCEDTLSPVQWHLDGRAAGFYVGLHPAELSSEGGDVGMQLAYAYSETAPPTAEAIGNLVQEALANAMSQSNSFLRDQVAKGDPRAKES
ncbi:MAG: hypothetical protein ACLPLP_10530 [Mycobacterium sp.]